MVRFVLVSMLNIESIKPDMAVVCSEGNHFGFVDHLEGADTIKLVRDGTGEHHYIPIDWVVRVDEQVHIDRSGKQAKQEWRDEAEQEAWRLAAAKAFAPNSSE